MLCPWVDPHCDRVRQALERRPHAADPAGAQTQQRAAARAGRQRRGRARPGARGHGALGPRAAARARARVAGRHGLRGSQVQERAAHVVALGAPRRRARWGACSDERKRDPMLCSAGLIDWSAGRRLCDLGAAGCRCVCCECVIMNRPYGHASNEFKLISSLCCMSWLAFICVLSVPYVPCTHIRCGPGMKRCNRCGCHAAIIPP